MAGIVTVHDAERILGTMESVRPVSPLCALHYRAFQKQLLGAKASAQCPKQVIHLSSKIIASLAWWVSPAGFAANVFAPIRELDPTVEIWTDASLEHGGGHSSRGDCVQRSWTSSDLTDDPSINLLETRAACESVMALSEPGDRVRLHIDNRTAAAYIRCQGVQRVMYYLRKLFFSGSRLCQGMLLSFLLSGFLQGRTQQQASFQGMI